MSGGLIDLMPKPDRETLEMAIGDTGREWFEGAIRHVVQSRDAFGSYLTASAAARRNVGDHLYGHHLPNWTCADVARFFLLQEVLRRSPDLACIGEAYRYADEFEKCAIMKGLYLNDQKGELVDLAIGAGRTNSFLLFSSIAANNPYPALHYKDKAFNQLVLKALFIGMDIGCVVNLRQRISSELTSMCMDYVKERLAAERVLPPSIWLAINFSDLSDDDKKLYLQFS